jgi:hypothetical protein
VNLSSTGNITARILDAAGNSRAVTIASNGYTLDTQAPTVTAITDNTPGTATGVVNYTFNFSEDVGASFTAADITASGGATISNFIKVSPTQYTADITPPFGTGTMLVDVTTGSFQDIAGNVNTADTTANSQLYNISRAGQSVIDLGAFGKLIAPVQVEGQDAWLLDQVGKGFQLLLFVDAPPAPDVLAKLARCRSAPPCANAPVQVTPLIVTPHAFDVPGMKVIVDAQGWMAKRYDAQPGTTYLLRPDQHVLARWRSLDSAQLQAAMARALGPVGEQA